MQTLIELKQLNKSYAPKKGVAVRALKNISLKFADSGMCFILGKSGCGKTTLLNILGGLDSKSGGEI
jgi:ABC-type sugar transport system ATPase subunit